MADIELPRDIVGREIPLDTKVLYDRYGFKNLVKSFMYVIRTDIRTGVWRVKFTIGTSLFAVSDMHLADPIDRPDNPTCRNLSNDYRSFHCSRCGYRAFTYSDSDCDPEDFTYFPECRAEVVEDD